jgi:hypothetical protein
MRRWRQRCANLDHHAARISAAKKLQRIVRGRLGRQRLAALVTLLPKMQAMVKGRALRRKKVLVGKRAIKEAEVAALEDMAARKVVNEARAERELRLKRGQEQAAALAERSLMACAETEVRGEKIRRFILNFLVRFFFFINVFVIITNCVFFFFYKVKKSLS